MATASKVKFAPQDLPPPGGYPPIQTERIKLRNLVGWKTGIAALVFSNMVGWVFYSKDYRAYRRERVEMRSARMALQPILGAERDRAFLKQLIKNRKEEGELMKDYPGWEVGTYFGEPVYKTLPPDTMVEPTFYEYTIHAPPDGTFFVRDMHRHLT